MLGCSEARTEFTESAESTLREDLERDRGRSDKERERSEKLEAELALARRFWRRRWFGP